MAENELLIPMTKQEAHMAADALRFFAVKSIEPEFGGQSTGKAKAWTTLADHIESVIRGQTNE